MASALQVIGSFLAAALGWVVLEFVGRPLRKFFDLRGEIIRRLIEFANIRARWKDIPDSSGAVSGEREALSLSDGEIARLEEAQKNASRPRLANESVCRKRNFRAVNCANARV
jgi:hypothetical protein